MVARERFMGGASRRLTARKNKIAAGTFAP